MPRKKRDTSRKRESIIDAAIRAFQEDGFDNTSMDRIAEVAGASKRTVYNHFESKEDLFGAVVERFMGEAPKSKVKTCIGTLNRVGTARRAVRGLQMRKRTPQRGVPTQRNDGFRGSAPESPCWRRVDLLLHNQK